MKNKIYLCLSIILLSLCYTSVVYAYVPSNSKGVIYNKDSDEIYSGQDINNLIETLNNTKYYINTKQSDISSSLLNIDQSKNTIKPTLANLKTAIAHSQDGDAVAENLKTGKGMWVNGSYIEGNDSDANIFRNNGKTLGISDAQAVQAQADSHPTDSIVDFSLGNYNIHMKKHVHVDGSGNICLDDKTFTADEGSQGCFTAPIYHTHTDGCYRYSPKTVNGCDWPPSQGGRHTGGYQDDGGGHCRVCGVGWNYQSIEVIVKTLNCSRAGTIEHYKIGCGEKQNTIEELSINLN